MHREARIHCGRRRQAPRSRAPSGRLLRSKIARLNRSRRHKDERRADLPDRELWVKWTGETASETGREQASMEECAAERFQHRRSVLACGLSALSTTDVLRPQ